MYNTYGAPSLSTYQAALDWYEKTKPIRGATTRPIGNRRYHHSASIDKRGDNIVLVYERQPLIVWEPDSTFTLHAPSYYNAFQAYRLCGWGPSGMRFNWDSGRLFVTHNGNSTHLPEGGSLRFVPTSDSSFPTYQCVTERNSLEYKMRRGVASKLASAQCVDFLAWAQVVLATSTPVVYEECAEARRKLQTAVGYSPEFVKEMDSRHQTSNSPEAEHARRKWYRLHNRIRGLPFQLTNDGRGWMFAPACRVMLDQITSTDYTKWDDVLKVIAGHSGRSLYTPVSHGNGFSQMLTRQALAFDEVVEFIHKLIACVHRDTVFEVVPVRSGAMPSARNSGFFRDMLDEPKQSDKLSESSI